MNDYEAKQAAKRARLQARAERAATESEQLFNKAHQMADAIPFGQPILIGHHSEGRDRNYRQRITRTYQRSFEASDKAKTLSTRAARVGAGGISSDDPDAISKLRAELDAVRSSQEQMRAANRCIRKNDRTGLMSLGFTAGQIEELFKPDACGRIGFPDYALSNNNANARRIEKRIADLEARGDAQPVERVGATYTYREDPTENRVMLVFGGKPDADIRQLLKRHAFKWSPIRGAWVRQLNNAGRWAGECVRRELDRPRPSPADES